jgi:hypothetical protein
VKVSKRKGTPGIEQTQVRCVGNNARFSVVSTLLRKLIAIFIISKNRSLVISRIKTTNIR